MELFYYFCSMLKTLERYQKCNYGAPEANTISRETQVNTGIISFIELFIYVLIVLYVYFEHLKPSR